MNILAFFTSSGVPQTGLSPTIRIRDVSTGTLVVTDAAMTEVGDGHYKYNFTGYSPQNDYSIRCDGGASLPSGERYTYAGNENYIDDIDWVIDNNTTILGVSGDVQGIKLNTENIPTSGQIADAVWNYEMNGLPSGSAGGLLVKNAYNNKVVLNSGTIYSQQASGAIDFTSYVEIDPFGRITTVTADKIESSQDLPFNSGQIGGRVYKDYGTNYFLTDYEFQLEYQTYRVNTTTGNIACFWCLSPSADVKSLDLLDQAEFPYLAVYFQKLSTTTGRYTLKERWGSGSNYQTDIGLTYTITGDPIRYFNIRRTNESIYGKLYCEIYKDKERNNLVETLSLPLSAENYFKYHYPYMLNGPTDGFITSQRVRDNILIPYEFAPIGFSGQSFPIGTKVRPSDNLQDSLIIYNKYYLDFIELYSDLTIDRSVENIIFDCIGIPTITFTGSDINDSQYFKAKLKGNVNNYSIFADKCQLDNLTNFSGSITNSIFLSNVDLGGSIPVIILDCFTNAVELSAAPVLNVNNTPFIIKSHKGPLRISDQTYSGDNYIELWSGSVKLESTCVSGTIKVSGVGTLVDETGPNCTVDSSNLIQPYYINNGIATNQALLNNISTNIFGLSGQNEAIKNDTEQIISDIATLSISAGANPDAIADAVWNKTTSAGGLTTEQILINNNELLKRVLGLVHENIYIDNSVYDGDGNLTSARVRIYSTPSGVGTANDVIGTYQITAPGDGAGRFTYWKQVKA